jgi:hypothetical protein
MGRLSSSAYVNAGPYATLLRGDAMGRILDQGLLLGRLEFTVSTIAEGTDLTYKTVKTYLDHLQKIGLVLPTRKLGNAQAYRFDVENHMSGLIEWGSRFQSMRNKSR